MKKVWVIYDVLTHGIREAQLTELTDRPLSKGAFVLFTGYSDQRPDWFPSGSWRSSYKNAVKAANKQVDVKIKSLELQIERLKRKYFV